MVIHLVKRVGARAPVRQDQAQPDRLGQPRHGADGDGVERALLCDEGRDQLAHTSLSANCKNKKRNKETTTTSGSSTSETRQAADGTHTGPRTRQKHQPPEIRGALVAQRARGVDQRRDAVRLHHAAEHRAAPAGRRRRRLLAAEELLLGVGPLRLAVCRPEDGPQHRQRDGVRVRRAEGDGARLDGGQV